MLSWRNSSLNEGTAITTRITTGTTVQSTSSRVLCVVRDGIGLARALKRTITISSRTSTKSGDRAMMIQSRKSWNQMMLSITGVADCWKPSCQGDGCPSPAQAAPAPPGVATHRHRQCGQPLEHQHRRRRSFDEMRLSRACRAALRKPAGAGPARFERCVRQAAGSGERAAGPQGNPSLSNHNSGRLAMHPVHVSHATKGQRNGPGRTPRFSTLISATMPRFTNP